MTQARPVALLGGIDPAGWAGLAADLQVCQAFGVRGMPVVAARTAQRTGHWSAAWPTAVAELEQTIASLEPAAARKAGMIASTANAHLLAHWHDEQPAPLVVDPLLHSTSGGWMWPWETPETVRSCLRDTLLPRATVATPNWLELAWLSGAAVPTDLRQAQELAQAWPCPVLLKGGHAPQPWLGQDWLWDGAIWSALPQKSLWPTSPRGTGCRLATALAIGLGRGQTLSQASTAAANWLDEWYYGL